MYTNTISWQTPTRPLPMEINPQVVFERMFGDGGTPEVRALRRAQQRSVLDSLAEDLGGVADDRAGTDDRPRGDARARHDDRRGLFFLVDQPA